MGRIEYMPKRFGRGSLAVIEQANQICEDYGRQGFDLTLRQLYYQFVSRDLLPNTERSYKRLGSIVNDARLAGMIDWWHILDRTRNVRISSSWESPASMIRTAARGYQIDKWADQPEYVEVWIEKDALVGVLDSACAPESVPYFSCRGYTSASAIWRAAQRIGEQIEDGKRVTILHLGDHDPSGIDMTRDVEDRLAMFIAQDRFGASPGWSSLRYLDMLSEVFKVDRIALNHPQVERYQPPPNPAKLSDSRASEYVSIHGYSSWELDALEPSVLVALICEHIERHRDPDLWEEMVDREHLEREILTETSDRWAEVKEFLGR